jgi:hypothetical protein
MKRIRTVLVAMLFISMLTGSRAFGQESSVERRAKTLEGISGVDILVEDLDDDAKALGLNTESIQADVELKLRLAGMRIVHGAEYFYARGHPYIYVSVGVAGRAAAYKVDLCQDARLARNGDFSPGASTWSSVSVQSNPTAESIRSGIRDLVDEFIKAWLSVNPK